MSLLNPELLEVALRPLIESIIEQKLEPRLAELITLRSISAESEKLIPVKEMASILSISVSHLYKKFKSKEKPHKMKFGRLYFYLSEIKKWIDE